MEQIATRIGSTGGGALVIDYGHEEVHSQGGSLRGIANHKFVSPLERPGEVDGTAANRTARHCSFRSI